LAQRLPIGTGGASEPTEIDDGLSWLDQIMIRFYQLVRESVAVGILSVLVPSLNLLAQTPATNPAAKRPKIGLVLEGGGALGLAHVGVLDWIEKNHIPVDYVAGTSMGGLVAGLYASGKSPEEIRRLTEEIKWDDVLKGQIPFQERSYRRKEDKVAYPNRLEFGLKTGFSLPAGLNSGQDVGFILDRALLPYYDMKSFDDLPIPFRCVATDMNLGEKKVFDRGTLSQALRATMSIPLVFAPVSIDGHLYTDGAALDNLPVDVAKDMGADIIIAVYLDTGPVDPKTYDSILGAAGRNIAIMISANELKSIQAADILISVDLKEFTSLDFSQGAKIPPRGFAAAEKKQAMLSKLSVSPEEWSAYMTARNARIRTSVPAPQFVSVVGLDAHDQETVQSDLAPLLGKPVDPPVLEDRLTKLTGQGFFNSLNYGLTDKNGQTGLAIRGQAKPYGPPFMLLNINLDGSEPSDVRFGMSARFNVLNLGSTRAEWRSDIFFGSDYGVRTELYRPFKSGGNFFAAARGYAEVLQFNIYQDNTQVSQYHQRRNGFGLDLGYILSPRSEIRLGEDTAWYGISHVSGTVLGQDSTTFLGISSLRYNYFGQDTTVLPRSGLTNSTKLQWYSARPNGGAYWSADSRTTYFHRTSLKTSAFIGADGGTTFGAKNLQLQGFTLGGPFRLGAYGENELLGNQYFLFRGGATYELFKLNPLIGSNVSAMVFYELGKMYGSGILALPTLPQDGTVALVVRTAFGPVFAGGSFGDSGHYRWWFGLGRIF
jgi:NTE family protein